MNEPKFNVDVFIFFIFEDMRNASNEFLMSFMKKYLHIESKLTRDETFVISITYFHSKYVDIVDG